jgi:hypothetical protein
MPLIVVAFDTFQHEMSSLKVSTKRKIPEKSCKVDTSHLLMGYIRIRLCDLFDVLRITLRVRTGAKVVPAILLDRLTKFLVGRKCQYCSMCLFGINGFCASLIPAATNSFLLSQRRNIQNGKRLEATDLLVL